MGYNELKAYAKNKALEDIDAIVDAFYVDEVKTSLGKLLKKHIGNNTLTRADIVSVINDVEAALAAPPTPRE